VSGSVGDGMEWNGMEEYMIEVFWDGGLRIGRGEEMKGVGERGSDELDC